MTRGGWGEGAPDPAEAPAARLRRLQLDNDDLRAENARLKRSVGERQAEIEALGERVGRLHAELAEARRRASMRTLGRLSRTIRAWARGVDQAGP